MDGLQEITHINPLHSLSYMFCPVPVENNCFWVSFVDHCSDNERGPFMYVLKYPQADNVIQFCQIDWYPVRLCELWRGIESALFQLNASTQIIRRDSSCSSKRRAQL